MSARAAAAPKPANDRRIALFDLQRQRRRLGEELRTRMDTVLAHGQFILGPEVDQLEKRLSSFSGAAQSIAVSSGRDALMIALMAMNVGPGDAVFVPAFTFAATAGSVASVGAMPVFVDVLDDTFNMDPADLARAVKETLDAGTLKPRVVMPVDLYGLPADYPAIGSIAAEYGLTVLADAAQSFGGGIGNRRVGALAPVSATSFYPTKPLGCYGDGGAITTEDPAIADAVKVIRSHGRSGDGDEAVRLGLTGRLDTLQAAILLAKLDVFEEELRRRRAIAARYSEALSGIVTTPKVAAGYQSAFALYTIRVKERDRVRTELDALGVGTGLFYRLALHQHPAFRDLAKRPLPVAERLAMEVLSLPVHPDLDEEEVAIVIAAVTKVMRPRAV